MSHTVATWKTLEDLLLTLRKKDIHIPSNILEDLRAARSMIELSSSNKDAYEKAATKATAYTANVETYLINQAQKIFEPNIMDEWLQCLKENNPQTTNKKEHNDIADNRFVIGVPRNQKWIRIKTNNKLPEEYILKLAKKHQLTTNKQTDGHLIVYGQLNDIKSFIKQIATKPTN
ncbi:MAG: DUF2096 family protein [Candidatus Bathyarchaeota archaeon]|nr:DUF2096 family protein [Candidatus Termiticorpusculum sp.]